MRRISIAAAILLATFTPAAFAEAKSVNASREQVADACDANGGFAWGVGASSGRYGCITENAWVECDEDGNCAGDRAMARGSALVERTGGTRTLSR